MSSWPITVKLQIELKDGWTAEVVTAGTIADPGIVGAAGRQAFDYETICTRLQDMLVDATKHDETIGWRVVAVDGS